ncbi:hypothetical protein OAC38_00185 [Candidatus Poseidoniaceae archaeon]|nr:hypothetical protein [Candidatus Poseidoniaceae archaeon]
MFAGTVQSLSHEGGLLVSFTGSSPALESIIVNLETGDYIGKVDAVLGSTSAPLAHVAHLDRKLDIPALVGIEVNIRAKKVREERKFGERGNDRQDRGRNDRGGRFEHNDRGGRFERNDRGGRPDRNDRSNGGDWDCPKCRNNNFAFRHECNRCGEPRGNGGGGRSNDRGFQDREQRAPRFERNDRQNNRMDGDWDCPKCHNDNFAWRTECNKCGAPKAGGGQGRPPRRDDRRSSNDRDNRGGDRRGGDRRGGETFNDNDWDCPQCNNSNFAFRQECNRCGVPRSGGQSRPPRRDDRRGGDSRGGSSYGGGGQRGGDRRGGDSRGGSSYGGGGQRGGDRRGGDSRGGSSYGGGGQRGGDSRGGSSYGGGGQRGGDRSGSDDRRGGDRQVRSNFGGDRGGNDGRRPPREPREPREFRKARGKSSGHAHNRPPRDLMGRDRED